MSVIVRNRCGVGNSYKGFPTEDINILSKCILSNTLHIKFEDPEDSIKDGITLSAWKGTILVYKEGSYPTSPTDGTVLINSTTRNAYKNTEFTRNISSNNTLYFRFYTYNTDKVYNDSTSMMFTLKNINADPILANNSWDTINKASEAGIASSIWNIEDEINIYIKGAYNYYDQTLTMQIADFNRFDKSDGSGKAGIVFVGKNLLTKSDWDMGAYTWEKSKIRSNCSSLISEISSAELQNVIKEVSTSYTYDYNGGSEHQTLTAYTNDKIFIPSYGEAIGDRNNSPFPIFTDNASRIRKGKNVNNSGWWTRDAIYNRDYCFYMINNVGGTEYVSYSSNHGVLITFCV